MKVVVTDVSVFFDLYKIEALPEFFALDLDVCTTDFVYKEILQTEQKETFELFERSNKLTILTFTAEEEVEVSQFKTKWQNRSLNDKTILWKSLQLKSILLTCDGKLKKEAEYHQIEVHGSIWLVEQMVEHFIVGKPKGILLLERLKQSNFRLPMDVIDKLIKKWKT